MPDASASTRQRPRRESPWFFAHGRCAEIAVPFEEPEPFPIIYPTRCAVCTEPMDHLTNGVVRWRKPKDA